MPFITVGAENGHDIDLHYDDFGSGDPVVLVHGWPLSGRSWEGQIPALVDAGHRVVAYDRRGFGQSSQPWGGYDYDTFAADLDKLITELGLTNVTLIGFSMGGGELARYASRYGTSNIKKLVFASAVPPYLWKSDDNPDGAVDQDLADWFANGITGDRPAFLHQFVDMFYTAGGEPGLLKKPLVSDDQRAYDLSIAELASPKGTLDCTVAFATTDFRDDLTKIDVPTLVIHGDADGIVPFEASGKRTAAAIPNAQTHVIEGGPHGVLASHKDEWNEAVLRFLAS